MFVHETIRPDPSAKLLSFRHYKSVWRLLSTGGAEEGGRPHRCQLWLYLFCFFVVVAVHFGSKDLLVLYELSSPLCWGSALIGYGSAALHLAYLSSLLGLRLMQHRLADSWVALVGLVSNVSGLVVFSVADTAVLMFTGERMQIEVPLRETVATEASWFLVFGGCFDCRQVTVCVSCTWQRRLCSDRRCPNWWMLRSKVRGVKPNFGLNVECFCVASAGGFVLFCFFLLRGLVCHRSLCGKLVFSGGQRPLQFSLPSHAALHEGLLFSVRCRPPPPPRWHHRVGPLFPHWPRSFSSAGIT